jgi:hypothetical protein
LVISDAVVAIVTPASSLSHLKRADGAPLFEFNDICPRHLFESQVEGHRNEVGSQFYTRRRQVRVLPPRTCLCLFTTSTIFLILHLTPLPPPSSLTLRL